MQTGAWHPRNNPDWSAVGIFAQRAKGRPHRIGVSVCRLLAVDGLTLTVHALEVRQPAWSHELMTGYRRTAPR